MTICHTTDTTFKSDLKTEGFTLVNFWAPWCGPCRYFAPILETFDQEYSTEVRVLKVNADEQPNTAAHYGIMSLPTTILFKDGNPINKIVGAVSVDKLKQFISDNTN
ncbi:thioredoxin [Paenibacillus sp. DMB20]|uniref:thioredoxin n=1 Tax=Paenibacillus sp. DMB20 TaxID=1642570 RepID=UPI000627CF23|nr:thioredoxin [Paenibacillus sp. DMB20]KKO55360.1 thioredoxin [Paenibacillus sp. DMB20]